MRNRHDEALTEHLKSFIKNSTWIFAKSYAKTWPHEYIIQEKVDNDLFLELANFIDNNGYTDYFYKKEMIYLEYDEHVYWHMENIINRCLPPNTYSQRKIDGRLPNI